MSNQKINYTAFFNEVIKNTIQFDNVENSFKMDKEIFCSETQKQTEFSSAKMPKMTLAEFINQHNFA
ncbi:hypothetical protein IJG72_03725 [bacterium]|nr:hypothetical protein [bacterium]